MSQLIMCLPERLREATELDILKSTESRMSALRKAEIERLQRAIRHLAHSNDKGQRHNIPHSVNSDDLRALEGIVPERRKHRERWFKAMNNIIGIAFRTAGLVRLHPVASKCSGGHGRMIMLWTLKEYESEVRSFLASQEHNN